MSHAKPPHPSHPPEAPIALAAKPNRWSNGSLAPQLFLLLLVPHLLIWLLGAIGTYRLASSYVDQAVDASLLQASRSLARQLKPIDNGLLIDFPKAAQDILEADPNDRLLYTVSSPPGQFILGNQSLPLPPRSEEALSGVPLFYNATIDLKHPSKTGQPQDMRIVALQLAIGDGATATDAQRLMLVQVARSKGNREELAKKIVVDMMLPMAGLALLLAWLVWLGIQKGLAPLHRLRKQVQGRAPTDLAPIQLTSAPLEVRALVNAINTLLAAVQNNVSTQKRFIGDAAHQLRTPLAGLKSQTEIALQSVDDLMLKARLERVHESATRSAYLVNQLLTLARAEPESLMAQARKRFDLRRLAREQTALLVPRALRQHTDLGMDEDSDAAAVWVNANELLIGEALHNLLDNALHYAGEHAQITVAVHMHPGRAQLSVSDNGPGIAPQDHERMMERFVRGPHSGNSRHGCGLGLAIVREIIERHHGSVRLTSLQPQGLRVTVDLPLSDAPSNSS